MRTFVSINIKLKYCYNLLNRESSYKHINKIIDSSIFELLNIIIYTKLVRLKDKNSLSQSYFLSLINLIVN